MSQAFVKEEDGQWLQDLAPTLLALVHYLTRDNNGVRVYEIKTSIGKNNKELHYMSNGLAYFVNEAGRWEMDG